MPAGDGDHIRQARRHSRLASAVISPGGHCAIVLQRQAVVVAGGDGDHAAEARWYRGLTGLIVPPGNHGAAGIQRQAVAVPGGHGGHAGQTRWYSRLTILVAPHAVTVPSLFTPSAWRDPAVTAL